MKKFLVFFYLNGFLEIRSVNATSGLSAEAFIANAYSGRLQGEPTQDVNILYSCVEPTDWNKLYVVELEGIHYTLDSNYHLTPIDSRLVDGKFEVL